LEVLRLAHPTVAFEERIIQTQGDRVRGRPLPEIGGKGLFTRELEEALLSEALDAAVHSLKDLPTSLPSGLDILAVQKRAQPFDAVVSREGRRLLDLPSGARVGTSSLRRAAQVRAARPDVRVEPARGNLDTRIRKLRAGTWDAIVVAAAGLARLGRLDEAAELLSPDVMLPAVGQGAVAVEGRADDGQAVSLLAPLDDADTASAVLAERSFLRALGGGCHVPIAAYAEAADAARGTLTLHGMVASPDGERLLRAHLTGADPTSLGEALASRLLAMGAAELLEEVSA
jgi:hydroxymethylbilane synthase